MHKSKIDWPLWILAAIVVFSTIAFGGYYYIDRYNHTDQTVVQTQIQNAENMVRQNPQNVDLRVTIANYYLQAGMTAQAIEQSQQALSINANHQGALIVLGTAYQKMNKYDEALIQFNKVLDLSKDNPLAKIDPTIEMVHYNAGVIYIQQTKYNLAGEQLKQALEISPTDSDAHYALGLVYQNTSDYANAAKEFREAVRFTPDFVDAYSALATNDNALGNSAEAKYASAMVLLLQGQAATAAAQFQDLVTQSPNLKIAYYGLGLANERLGKKDQAIKALTEYVKVNPNDIAAQQALGRVSKGN